MNCIYLVIKRAVCVHKIEKFLVFLMLPGQFILCTSTRLIFINETVDRHMLVPLLLQDQVKKSLNVEVDHMGAPATSPPQTQLTVQPTGQQLQILHTWPPSSSFGALLSACSTFAHLSSHVNPFLLGGSVPVPALADLHSTSPRAQGLILDLRARSMVGRPSCISLGHHSALCLLCCAVQGGQPPPSATVHQEREGRNTNLS